MGFPQAVREKPGNFKILIESQLEFWVVVEN